MKNLSKKLLLAGCIAAAAMQAPASFAQNLVIPSNADQTWVGATTNAIRGLNVAQISYNNAMAPMAISAVAYYDGSGSEQIDIYDVYFNTSMSITYSGTLGGVPDIILGNDLQSGANFSTDFIAAVAYVNATGNVQVETYTFTDNFGAFSGGAILSKAISTGYQPHNVHLDNIAGATVSSFPVMSQLALTWDDFSGANPRVYAVMGDMNAEVPVTFCGSTLISNNGSMPDIAGAYWNQGGPSAWITYVLGSGNKLEGVFFQPRTNTLNSASLDNGSTSSGIKEPRIASMPTGSGVPSFTVTPAAFMVTAEVLNTSTNHLEIRNYSPASLAASAATGWAVSGVEDISSLAPYSAYTPPYNNFFPTVALGAQDYLTLHFMNYSGAGNDVLMLDPMDWTTWNSLFNPPNSYYWVNSQSGPYPSPTTASSYYASAVATPCNSQGSTSISAWAFFNGTDYQIDYKFSSPAPGSIAFRHAKPVTPKLDVYPNPATNILSVSNMTSVDDVTYEVTNMAGQLMMQGTLSGTAPSLDVNRLMPGNYIIKMHNSDVSTDKIFTKQ